MTFLCLQFLPKNEQKQVDLRCHFSKVEFIASFFGRINGLTICFRVLLTFTTLPLTILLILFIGALCLPNQQSFAPTHSLVIGRKDKMVKSFREIKRLLKLLISRKY